MTATDLYNDLVLHGFSLSVQGGNLILSPSSQLSQTQRLEIKQHKSELLLLLAANESYSPLEDGQLNRKSEEKQSPKNFGDVLKTEQITTPNIRDTFTQIEETSQIRL